MARRTVAPPSLARAWHAAKADGAMARAKKERAVPWAHLDGPVMSEIAGAMSVLRASRGASPRVHATKPSRNDNGEGRGRQTTVSCAKEHVLRAPLSFGKKMGENGRGRGSGTL